MGRWWCRQVLLLLRWRPSASMGPVEVVSVDDLPDDASKTNQRGTT